MSKSKVTYDDLVKALFRVAMQAEVDHYTNSEISNAFQEVADEYDYDR